MMPAELKLCVTLRPDQRTEALRRQVNAIDLLKPQEQAAKRALTSAWS
jgi:hypothetical protein